MSVQFQPLHTVCISTIADKDASVAELALDSDLAASNIAVSVFC